MNTKFGSFNRIVQTQEELIIKFLSKGFVIAFVFKWMLIVNLYYLKLQIPYMQMKEIPGEQRKGLERWVGGECLLCNH